ncbi:MAG: hypothetical protein MUC88_07405 [Planctomycetes bacterium]|nr:hypothetical protein [Planctomycetota bacterium]
MTRRDLGVLGPVTGPAVSVPGARWDSLRGIYLWFVLGGLLLLRRANRTRAAWTIFLPLLAVYGVLHVVEEIVNNCTIWSFTPFLCAVAGEMLRSLALGLALLLTVSDRIRIRSRALRAALILVIIVAVGSAAVALNTPLASIRSAKPPLSLPPAVWSILFGIAVLIFLIGMGLISAVLRRLTGRRALLWFGGICFALGTASILVLVGTKLLIDSAPLMNTRQLFFYRGALLEPLLAPYLVFFWFILLALASPFYRRRFTHCFLGESRPAPDGEPG